MVKSNVTDLTVEKDDAMEDLQIERLERKVDMSLDEIIKMQKKTNRKANKSTRKPFVQRQNAHQVSAASQSSFDQLQAKSGEALPRRGASTSRAAARRTSFKNNRLKARTQNWTQSRRASGSAGANKNVRIQIFNESSRRFPTGMRKGKAMERLRWGPDKVLNSKRLQTLDSRFASLKSRRQWQQPGDGSSHAVSQKRSRLRCIFLKEENAMS